MGSQVFKLRPDGFVEVVGLHEHAKPVTAIVATVPEGERRVGIAIVALPDGAWDVFVHGPSGTELRTHYLDILPQLEGLQGGRGG